MGKAKGFEMKQYIVVSALGKDRPGFVNRITHAIKDLGGNIELQRSTRMADDFALIVLFSIECLSGGIEKAVARLAALKSDDLLVTARAAVAPPAKGAELAGLAELVASGADQPGIIDAVTHALFQHNINIESMDYDTESAPMTGDHLFKMTARLAIPKGLDMAILRAKLRELEQSYNFDILLRFPVE
jgi:glycine cleavage system transcriptional repressor